MIADGENDSDSDYDDSDDEVPVARSVKLANPTASYDEVGDGAQTLKGDRTAAHPACRRRWKVLLLTSSDAHPTARAADR